jgi:hypothetical protein
MRKGTIRAAVTAAVAIGVSSVWIGTAAGQAKPEPEKTPSQTTQAGPATPEAPIASTATLVTSMATIEKIDKASGTVTLKGPQGNTFEAKAGPAVDLDRLKAGDRVRTSYFEEVAVAIKRHPEGPPKVAMTNVLRGGVTAQQATITARIDSVDADKKTLTFRGPEGTVHTLKVEDPSLAAQLSRIHPGDSMDVTYTQAVAISVEPPQREPAKEPAAPQKAPAPPAKEPGK